MRSQAKTNLPTRYGFTLAELLVVIAVMGLLLGTLSMGLGATKRMGQTEAAINTISAAVAAIRSYATQDKPDMEDTRADDPVTYSGFTYSGVALIFTPAGELRLVENDQNARNSSNNFLESPTVISGTTAYRSGYADLPGRDYIKLPRDIGVVGIARGGTGAGTLYLFTPPFALRFDENGSLISGQPTINSGFKRVVYYDGNYNNAYSTSSGRTTGYNPDAWDPSVSTVAQTQGRYHLPFEELETVVGVVVYSKKALRDAGHNHAAAGSGSPINTTAHNWILDPNGGDGKVIFFSRHSGARMRQWQK